MSYTPELIIPAHDAVLTRIDAGGATGPAAFRIYDVDDVLLVELPLAEPAGTVDQTTGVLTLDPGPAGTAAATGDAVSASLVDSDGVVLGDSFEVQEGSEPVPGYVVLSNVSIVSDGTVELISATIGA